MWETGWSFPTPSNTSEHSCHPASLLCPALLRDKQLHQRHQNCKETWSQYLKRRIVSKTPSFIVNTMKTFRVGGTPSTHPIPRVCLKIVKEVSASLFILHRPEAKSSLVLPFFWVNRNHSHEITEITATFCIWSKYSYHITYIFSFLRKTSTLITIVK